MPQEDEEDHVKFVKKMQDCFSSSKGRSPMNSLKGRKRNNSQDYIEDQERDEKAEAYNHISEQVTSGLRASLTDIVGDADFQHRRRDRSASNEKFDLPPLPDFDDNKDLYQQSGDDQDDDFMINNYKSNEQKVPPSMFAALGGEDDDDGGFGSQMALLGGDDDNGFGSLVASELQQLSSSGNLMPFEDLDKDDDFERVVEKPDFSKALGADDALAFVEDTEAEVVQVTQKKEIEAYNSIFDKIDELDRDEPTTVVAQGKSDAFQQSLEEISNDFPGITVKANNFLQGSPRQIAKSMYVPS